MITQDIHDVKQVFVHSVTREVLNDRDVGTYYRQVIVVVTENNDRIALTLYGDSPIRQLGQLEKTSQYTIETESDGVVWSGDNKDEALRVLESEGGVIVDHHA